MTNPTPGTEALIKHCSSSISASSSLRYQTVQVTRVTKARVFARAMPDGREREFRLDNLREYGVKRWDADELIVDTAAIAETRAALEVEKARRALEASASHALSRLSAMFEGYTLRQRTEAEILALVEFAATVTPPPKAD